MPLKKKQSPPKILCAKSKLVAIGELVPHPENPNTHPARQIELLTKIILAQGWRAPIVVSNRSGYIVAGHARLLAAQELNCEKVPVDFQDFKTEADEYAHLVADNRIAEIAELDFEGIASILKKLDGEVDLDLTGFLDFEREPLLQGQWVKPEITDLPEGSSLVAPILVTEEQRGVFENCVARIRSDEGDAAMPEGRIVELLAADYMAG